MQVAPLIIQGVSSLRRSEGDPRPNRLRTLSAPGAGKGLLRLRMQPAPMCASIPCSLIPIQGICVKVDTSGYVINSNTNTAFKCVSHMLGNLQFLQTVAELGADAHYYFAHSFNSPWGSKASSMCPVRPRWSFVGQRVWWNKNAKKKTFKGHFLECVYNI